MQKKASTLREVGPAEPTRAPIDNTDLVSVLSNALLTRRNKIEDDEEEEEDDLEWLDEE